MQDHYIVRPLAKNEWENVRTLRLEALKEYPRVYFRTYEDEAKCTDQYWQDILAEKESCMFGLFDRDKLIGIAGVLRLENAAGVPRHEDVAGVIVRLYVKREYQRKGFSARLMQACIDWSIGCKAWTRLTVAHRASNEAARRLIAGLGLSCFETIKNKKYPNGDVEDEYWYQIDLDKMRHQKGLQQ